MSYEILTKLSADLLRQSEILPFIRQAIFERLEPPIQNVVILKGARGVGKSTVIKQFLVSKQAQHRVFYVSADSIFLDERLADLVMQYNDRGGEYIAIDEIHKYPGDWQRELKTIIDSFPRIKVIVSGSSSLKLDFAIADLSRRHIMLHVKGLSFREYIQLLYGFEFKSHALKELIHNADEFCHMVRQSFMDQRIDLLNCFHTYLQEGYFLTRSNYPSQEIYYDSLVGTMNSIIDVDISYVHRDVDPVARDKIKSILRHISAKCPFIPNISKLATDLNLGNDNVLKKYLFYLSEGEVLLNLYPSNKSHKDFPKPQKIFLNNTNFSYALKAEPNLGTLRETFVANCLNGLGELTAPDQGDFCLDGNTIFEVGGKNKNRKQLKGITNSHVLADNILSVEHGHLPLWLLGFLW